MKTMIEAFNLLDHSHRYLYKSSANINRKNNKSATPLHSVVLHGHVKVVKYLCENGATINMQDEEGYTPCHLGAYYGDLDVVMYLHTVEYVAS